MAYSLKWWDGYSGQDTVIIDDFRYASIADIGGLSYLLRMLDRYEFKVEIKGGCRVVTASHFIITCPYPPDVVFTYDRYSDKSRVDENIGQLIRRITQIVEIKVVGEEAVAFDLTAQYKQRYLRQGGEFHFLDALGVIGAPIRAQRAIGEDAGVLERGALLGRG